MHPGDTLIYGDDGRNVYEPTSDADLESYIECGLRDLIAYLAR